MIDDCQKAARGAKNLRLRTNALVLAAAGAVAAFGLNAGAHGPKAWPVPEAARRVLNPAKVTPASIAATKKIYDEMCVQCHGDKGKGDGTEAMMYTVKPANFSDKHMMDEMTDGEIFYKISEGRRPMPSFKNGLSEDQRWQLVHFVRTFAAPIVKSPAKKSPPAKTHKH